LGSVAEKEKRTPFLRRGVENEFEIFAETEIEHLVRLVQYNRLEVGDLEPTAFQMIAQAPRRTHDDMRALRELARLATRIHAADTGDDPRIREGIEPLKFAMNLKRQLACRRNDESQRFFRLVESVILAQQGRSERQPIGDRLAGARLCGNQKIAPRRLRLEHGRLNRCGIVIVAPRQRTRERRVCR